MNTNRIKCFCRRRAGGLEMWLIHSKTRDSLKTLFTHILLLQVSLQHQLLPVTGKRFLFRYHSEGGRAGTNPSWQWSRGGAHTVPAGSCFWSYSELWEMWFFISQGKYFVGKKFSINVNVRIWQIETMLKLNIWVKCSPTTSDFYNPGIISVIYVESPIVQQESNRSLQMVYYVVRPPAVTPQENHWNQQGASDFCRSADVT